MSIFERFGFGTKKSEEKEQSLPIGAREIPLVENLYSRRHSMSSSEIIDGLERLHNDDALALYALDNNRFSLVYLILEEIAKSDLSSDDAVKLAKMLFWSEIRKWRDGSHRLEILAALERNVNPAILTDLQNHLKWVEKEIERAKQLSPRMPAHPDLPMDWGTDVGTHRWADLHTELNRTKKLIETIGGKI